MRFARRFMAAFLFFFLAALFPALAQDMQTPDAQTPSPQIDASQSSDTVEPQIVRIRMLEGDVRVSRGHAIEKAEKTEWERAVQGLPLETGFNLATGVGRAEIEFEDGSTVYLGENSVLSLDDLQTIGDIPYTEINLLAGTVTLHLQPDVADDTFVLQTPTDRITTTYPATRYLRVNSYLDAISMTPLTEIGLKTTVGETVFHNNGKLVEVSMESSPLAFAEWDSWVANRVALRSAAANAVATASGLPASTPGLADMNGQGAFFKCEPYGTCWEPPAQTSQPNGQAAQIANVGPDFDIVLSPPSATIQPGDATGTTLTAVGLSGFTFPIDVVATLPSGLSCVGTCDGQVSPGETLSMQFASTQTLAPGMYTVELTGTSGPLSHTLSFPVYVMREDAEAIPFEVAPAAMPYFPCFPTGVQPTTVRTTANGRAIVISTAYGYGGPSYDWAVCHTGSWIFRNNIYIWVAPLRGGRGGDKDGDRHRHHHPPIHWIKCGNKYCYVPRHPHDERGKLPLNSKHDVYRLDDKKGKTVERVKLDEHEKVELMERAPKEFDKPEPLRLAHADDPMIRMHEIASGFTGRNGAPSGGSGQYLQLDRKSQRFVLARDIADGKHVTTETETFEERRENLRMSANHGDDDVVETRGFGGAPSRDPHANNARSSGENSAHSFSGGGSHNAGGNEHHGSTGAVHTVGGISHAGGGSHMGGGSHSGSHTGGGSHTGSHTGGGSHSGGGRSHTGSHH